MSRTLSAVFLRTAERIATKQSNQICYALPKVSSKNYKMAFALADYYISEDGILMRGGMFGMPACGVRTWGDEGREHRVLALCLMAEIVKDEENLKGIAP